MVRYATAHPRRLDLALWALILAVSCYALAVSDWLSPRTVVIALALCAPLALRRAHPVLSFTLIAVVAAIQWLISVPQLADAALLVALFSVADRARSLHIALALAVVEAGAIAATLQWIVVHPLEVWVGLSGMAVAAAGLGLAVRQRRELLESLRERADRLELERDQQAELAAAAERARIAREMHDIVSHNLTVMIALADGASYAMENSSDGAAPAIERISATGRQALSEMRRLLGVLRDEPTAGPLEPQPSLARLDELIGTVQAAGIPVTVRIEGEPQRLSEGVQLTVFRVAQEALTNTLKHAVEPSRASLTLRCGEDRRVELEIVDDGRALVGAGAGAGAPGLAGPGAGRGLPGMRERAAAYGGELEAGPLADGGWRVRLVIDG